MNYKAQLMWVIFSISTLHAYHASVIVDDDPLLQPNSYHLIGLEENTFLIQMLLNENHQCSYRIYNFLSTLSVSGVYRLANSVTGTITITANDVMLDLSGNTLTGALVVQSGVKNVTIKRGTVNATSTDGIQVNTGCSAISIYDISVQNATNGIHLIQTTDSVLERCTMMSNVTGMFVDTSSNLVIKSCNALRNSQTGFSLNLSTTCALLDCEALSTGDTNMQVLNNNVYGFVSQNGFGNIFDRCTANGTQALTTTDFGSVVAGFALTGTEQFSRITNGTVGGGATSSSGVTVPYGIWLQGTTSNFSTVTFVNSGGGTTPVNESIFAVSWSSDGVYLAAVGTNTSTTVPTVFVYQFNGITQGFVQVASTSPQSTRMRGVAWSPDNQYLAIVADITGSNTFFVYKFDRINNTLTQLVSTTPVSTVNDRAFKVAWSPNGQYIVVTGEFGSTPISFFIYVFNPVAQKLTSSLGVLTPSGLSQAIAWSPDGKYLVAGSSNTPFNIYLYVFSPSPLSAVLVSQISTGGAASVLSFQWSPDGQYLAAATGTFNIYSINGQNQLVLVASITEPGALAFVSWSSDGQYLALAMANASTVANIYRFDRGTLMLQQVGQLAGAGGPGGVIWSPDGTYIVIGGNYTSAPNYAIVLYTGLNFPSNNVIKNNVVSSNTGARYPSGVGISGSSIANLIIQNTAYQSPRNPTYVFTNYQFVCNVFNQLTGMAPTYLQNTEVNNLVLQSADLDTTLKIIESKLVSIQLQVTALIPFS